MLRYLSFLRDAIRSRRKKDNLPRFLTYTVTFGCNARCIMCDSWKLSTQNDLKLDEIRKIFGQLPRMDAVRLTGGEPFVRQDMKEIHDSAIASMRPLVVHITSNGFLTDRIVEFCEQRNRTVLLQLLISVDGIGEKHNQIRGSQKAWSHVVRTIEQLAPRRKALRLKLMVNQTIVDAEGAKQYRELRDFLKQYDVKNNIVMAYDESATYSLERDRNLAPNEVGNFSTFGNFSTEQLTELLDQADEDLRELPLFERLAKRYYLKGIRNRLLNAEGSPNPNCVALSSHLRIFPNGDVPTCQFNSQVVGNLRVTSFSDLWESVKRKEQRAWVRRCAGCWAECEVLPNAIYSLDLLKPIA